MRSFGEAPPPPTLMERLTAGLSRSAGSLGANLTGVFSKKTLDSETVAELEEALIKGDLGAGLAVKLSAAVAKGRYDKEISESELRAVLAAEIGAVAAAFEARGAVSKDERAAYGRHRAELKARLEELLARPPA